MPSNRSCEKHLKIENSYVREMFAEFLGTFILVIFGDGAVAQAILSRNTLGSAMSIHWSFGIGVALGVYVSGGVSGGHLNPAVSVAMACLGKCPWRKVPFYIIAQYLGSFCASAVIYLVYLDALNDFDGGTRMVTGSNATAGIWATYPAEFTSIYTCLGDQILGTALLLIGILAITDERNMEASKGFQPFAIGLVLFGIGMTYHLNCGFAVNPARDLGPRIFTCIAGWGIEVFSYRDYKYFWVPVIGPHVGAILGAFMYKALVGWHWGNIYEVPHDIRDDGGFCEHNQDIFQLDLRKENGKDKRINAYDNGGLTHDL